MDDNRIIELFFALDELSEVVSGGETPEGALIPGGTRPAGGPPEANQVQETGQPAHYDVIYGEGE